MSSEKIEKMQLQISQVCVLYHDIDTIYNISVYISFLIYSPGHHLSLSLFSSLSHSLSFSLSLLFSLFLAFSPLLSLSLSVSLSRAIYLPISLSSSLPINSSDSFVFLSVLPRSHPEKFFPKRN